MGPVGAPRGDAMGMGGVGTGAGALCCAPRTPPRLCFPLAGGGGGSSEGILLPEKRKAAAVDPLGTPPAPPPRLILGAILGRPHSVLE